MQQTKLTAGDSLNYTVAVAGYVPADGWVLKYRLVPRSGTGTAVDITSSASGTDHLVQVGPSETANWAAGMYGWASYVERAGERYTVASGQLQVLPDPLTLQPGADTRSQAEISLEAVTAKLRGVGGSAVESYTINGRELRRYPLADLIKLEQKLKAEVAAERRAAGLKDGTGTVRRILVRMP